jgi:hypothetical protein
MLDAGLAGVLLAVVAALAAYAGIHAVPWLRGPAPARTAALANGRL